jgi:hypothetical protein
MTTTSPAAITTAKWHIKLGRLGSMSRHTICVKEAGTRCA